MLKSNHIHSAGYEYGQLVHRGDGNGANLCPECLDYTSVYFPPKQTREVKGTVVESKKANPH